MLSLPAWPVLALLAALADPGPASAAPPSPAGFPLALADATGDTVRLASPPRRIASLLPSCTEIVCAVGACGELAGGSDWDDYPPEAKAKPKVGGLRPDLEKLLGLRPDLVLGEADLNGAAVRPLRAAGLRAFFLPEGADWAGVEAKLRVVGRLLGRAREADSVVADMEARKAAVARVVAGIPRARRRTVFLEHSPGLYTAGRGTFLGDLIAAAGGINIAAGMAGWGRLNAEEVLKADPDAIVFLRGDNTPDTVAAAAIAARPGWSRMRAVRQGKVVGIPGDAAVRPGPRLAQALEDLARGLYPEYFPAPGRAGR